MNTTLLNSIRTSAGFARSVVYLVSIALIGLVVERVIYYTLLEGDVIEKENAIEKINRVAPHKARLLGLPKTAEQKKQEQQKSNDAKLSEAVVTVQDTLDVLAHALVNKGDLSPSQDKLNQLYRDLKKYDQQAMADFAKTEAHIEKHQLADVIKQRHVDMVNNYQTEMKTLLGHLESIKTLTDTDDKLDAVLAARKQLESKQLKRSQQPFDPNNLPFKSVQPDKNNKPKTTVEEFAQAGLFNTPYQQYAALGDFTYDKLAGASNPEYLAESDEIVISDAIKAKALELNYDPVKIYHWVLNNVEWLPTWGSMQDSDITLGSLKGNAFDIASLHIALLRASKIPARYVHGTIEVPEDKYRNWVGGFNSIDAAGDFASSGGIPTTAIVSGGKIDTVRMEHIWVEAAIDYAPSRGAINKDADSWVQMDPSFKQYEYIQGVDLASVSEVDGISIAQNFVNSGNVNISNGWIQNLDKNVLLQEQKNIQDKIELYLSQYHQNSTSEDIMGGRRVVIHDYPLITSSIQNKISVLGKRYSKIPVQLQNSVNIFLGVDILGQPIKNVRLSWAAVNNNKVTISFKPATEADEDVLSSFIDSNNIDISSISQSIPSYLINVKPELKVAEKIVMTGSAIKLGEEVELGFDISKPRLSTQRFSSPIVAGSYLALMLVSNSVSPLRMADLQEKLSATRDKYKSSDKNLIAQITREDILGDTYFSGVLGYYSEKLNFEKFYSKKYGVNSLLLPSSGTYGYVPVVTYFFGFPNSLKPGGLTVDIDNLSYAASNIDNNSENEKQYSFQTGILSSALEHSLPEQNYSVQGDGGSGVSAVKLLGIANEIGQKIYHITKNNIDTVIHDLRLSSDVLSEIRNSVTSDKEVIVHTDNITLNNWYGAGYFVLDPQTYSGAYKISGGLNGGGYAVAAGGLSGMVDALTQKLRNPNHVNGPLDELSRSFWLNKLAKATALLAFASSVYDIVSNDSLNGLQKFAMIASTFVTTIAAMQGAAFLGAFFANPVTGVIAGILLGVVLALALQWINLYIVENLARINTYKRKWFA